MMRQSPLRYLVTSGQSWSQNKIEISKWVEKEAVPLSRGFLFLGALINPTNTCIRASPDSHSAPETLTFYPGFWFSSLLFAKLGLLVFENLVCNLSGCFSNPETLFIKSLQQCICLTRFLWLWLLALPPFLYTHSFSLQAHWKRHNKESLGDDTLVTKWIRPHSRIRLSASALTVWVLGKPSPVTALPWLVFQTSTL